MLEKSELKDIGDIITTEQMKEFVGQGGECGIGKVFENAEFISGKILEKVFGNEIGFPIDIKKVVKAFGIGICETNLNVDIGFQIERVNGYIKKRTENEWVIYVDSDDSELIKRYIMAHELSHYFLDLTKEDNGIPQDILEQHCVDPMFSRNWDELLSDVLTAFIMFPPKLVLVYLEQYTNLLRERNIYPIDGFEWLRMLGQKAQVSSYFTIISYQYLKFYLCNLCNKEGENDLIIKYQNFFK